MVPVFVIIDNYNLAYNTGSGTIYLHYVGSTYGIQYEMQVYTSSEYDPVGDYLHEHTDKQGPGEPIYPGYSGYLGEYSHDIEITLDTSFMANNKAMCTLERIQQLTSIDKLLDKTFGEDSNNNLTFAIVKDLMCGTVNPNPASGCTRARFDPKNDKYIIEIDQDYINNSPILWVARTLVHEAIHANLLLANRESEQGVELTNTDFAINFDEFVSNENWNHIAMSQKYREVMEDALRDLHPYINDQEFIDEKNSLGSSWDWDKFYEYISWQGLQGTELYDEHVSNPNYEYESNIYLIDPVSGLYQTTKQPNCEE